ncbi:PREDICTED: angiopoietin-1 receptor-like isoform X1 [Branchiostoma belcheri]|uniref:receptor protein-tyrosine kinase n=1 Tax=Branchiostoma belcheri TaxID=7741 RepID=A0A6P4YIK5_BRABE|nr:PREDICTED: angiopoietin-1 receptor-like isoform X1 [Branchiostoma belcheri]
MACNDLVSSGVTWVVIVFCLISTSIANWTYDPDLLRTSLTLPWDDTGVDNSFVKFVVQLYRSKGRNCSDVYRPAMVQELPVYVWRQATFTGLQPGTLYCRNCTIVTTHGNKSCGSYTPINTKPSNSTDRTGRSFNSVSVTNTSITVTWPSFTEQRESGHLDITVFFYYMLDIMPVEAETKRPQMFYNETELEATFDALTPGKEYEIELTTAGNSPSLVHRLAPFYWRMLTVDIVSTAPSPVEEVSVITTDSTSVTFNLTPPKEGFVDLFQIQATSPHHTSPLVDVPFPDETLASVGATLSNLQPETTYNLSATAVAKGRTGQARVVTFTTEAVPVDPRLVGSVTTALVVTLIAAAFCTVWIVRRRKYKLDPAQLFKEVLEDIVGSEKMEPWLKNRKDLFLEELIGEGEFGHVRKGVLREDGQQAVIVAAKTLRIDRANEMTYRDFAKEASLLMEVNNDGGHVNIVSLVGLVVDGVKKKDPRYILVEYAEPGELLWYLVNVQNNRHQAGFPPGLGRQLTEVAIDIVRGMIELERRRITHRDLACRNIVLCSPDGQAGRLVAKISDFGLARDVYVTTQYMRHPLTNMLLPIKWMAIESLIEGVYSCKSDMWGFGVVLWEMATLGGTPYPEVYGYETLVTRLRRGYRLQKPNGCSDELYEVMKLCWQDDPDVRPTPDVMEDRLEQLMEQDRALFPET